MNNVKIAYTHEGEACSLTLVNVERVSETFSTNAKDLTLTTDIDNEGTPLTDEVLSTLMNSKIDEVSIASDTLNTALHDYTSIRTINKEYDLNNGVVKVFIYMQKWLGPEINNI